jgi:hypothetical protein
MSQEIPGADSTDQITNALIEEATQLMGAMPQFWGRYFCSLSNPSPYEYTHLNEDGPLREKGIKLLPIAEQTWRVAGSQEDGASDAQGNVNDLIETFGADYLAGVGQEFLMFLDVEGSPPSTPRCHLPTMPAGRKLWPLTASRKLPAALRFSRLFMLPEMTRQRGRPFKRTSLRATPSGSQPMGPIQRNFHLGR